MKFGKEEKKEEDLKVWQKRVHEQKTGSEFRRRSRLSELGQRSWLVGITPVELLNEVPSVFA